MKPIKEFLANYQNIAKIFTEHWFESELKKPHEERHLLAKQFSFDDTPYLNSISEHEFTHLEENLGSLQKEIQSKRSISKNLKNTLEYPNIIGQIEIAVLFKKIGFDIELEPHLPDSKKKADIKLVMKELIVFIEVRTLHDREGTIISKSNSMEISKMINHSIPTIKEIITGKSQQLSERHPGILVINLDNISRTLHFEGGFYECARDCPIISGMILYRHYFNNEGCRLIIDYFANPNAKIPLPNPIERLLEKGGITMSTWPEKDIALIEEINGKS
ncbi:MAG: hypothetical protein Q7T80_16505 [Methanoregula sp.]|nr:hypothetical protein [Methanoregula sp.]